MIFLKNLLFIINIFSFVFFWEIAENISDAFYAKLIIFFNLTQCQDRVISGLHVEIIKWLLYV